jgi:poly(3-hydroxybutyrate) depolymerase
MIRASLICVVALMSVTCLAQAPGEHKFTVQRPEGVRTYYVWVPRSYANSTGNVPIVFTFHGLGDHCQRWVDQSAFKPVAEANNFLLVYPCGSDGLLGVAWNAGTCCLRGSSIDDVAFTRQMITDIQKNFPRANPRQVFSSGMSNGAMMTELLSCRVPTLFAAMASVAGVTVMEPGNDGGLRSCSAAYNPQGRPLPILFVHGNGDIVVPWTGNAVLGFPDVPANFKAWSQRQNCTGNPVQTYHQGAFSNQVYQQCAGGVHLELMKHEGGSHTWPKTKDFDTPSYAWAFFKKVILAQEAQDRGLF